MKDVLDEIVAWKRIEVEKARELVPDADIHRQVESLLDCVQPSMSKAIAESGTGIIAEFKRRSPSKGWIKEEGKATEIPLSYQRNGASALSILTDFKYFGGKDEFIREARHSGVNIPILYKNFIIDEYQLFQARCCGASAVLLIAACLSKREAKLLLATSHELGLEALLEMHSTEELEYADIEPDMCGINNRNLGSFITDVNNSFFLAERLPKDAIKVSESGISDPKTIKSLKEVGFSGFLIGECFMKEPQPGISLGEFIKELS